MVVEQGSGSGEGGGDSPSMFVSNCDSGGVNKEVQWSCESAHKKTIPTRLRI